MPSGFRVRLEKQQFGANWRLIGARPRGTLCHKPCTVSGGGKSEISKSIANALLNGPVFVRDYHRDMDEVAEILKKDFSTIYKNRAPDARTRRPILSLERTLGSVIQLLTPSAEYTDEHNEWLRQLRQTVRQIVFTVKRYYRPEWGENWREHFTVDRINGFLGHELKFDNQPLVSNYLRVGYDPGRILADLQTAAGLLSRRKDPGGGRHHRVGGAAQVGSQRSGSRVRQPQRQAGEQLRDPAVPAARTTPSIRGLDRQAEADIASPDTFLSNYEPLTHDQVRAMVDHVVEFDRYTEPMKRLLADFNGTHSYVVSSAHPRLVNGKPSQNPRYLQKRPDLESPRESYLAEVAARLEREIPSSRPVHFPVNAVLAGRRNSPPDPAIGMPPLAAYGPIHYQELPELFMEFISSLTGKVARHHRIRERGRSDQRSLQCSVAGGRSQQRAGVRDSDRLCRLHHVRRVHRPQHPRGSRREPAGAGDLVPDAGGGTRTGVSDPQRFPGEGRGSRDGRPHGARQPAGVPDHIAICGSFSRPDFRNAGRRVHPRRCCGPNCKTWVCSRPAWTRSWSRNAASPANYFEDGSVEAACPPLKALLHIMACGSYEGKGIDDPRIRGMFTRESLLASDWYRERLRVKQSRDIALWQRHLKSLEAFRSANEDGGFPDTLNLEERFSAARTQLARVSAGAYLEELVGTIGADPFHGQMP